MDTSFANLPGMTRRVPGPGDAIVPSSKLSDISPSFQRKIILIATASITDSNIYNNGLYQNCFILYRLAEAIGWLPIFIVNKKPDNLHGIPDFVRTCRMAEIEDILKQPLPIKIYVEVGMSISSNLRKYLRMLGARTCKLYLGNIVNIDIETPMFFPGMTFSHHVVGVSGNGGQSNYSASKAGIIGFTKSIAIELGSRNIRCNAIAPGFIETEMTANLPQEVKDKWINDIPLRRTGKPDDVADVCVFLGSDLSSYVSGQVIQVCGGMNT